MPSPRAAAKELPKRETLVDFNRAVAGHAGTLCDPDGEMFIKPCTQDEIDFYQQAEAKPEFSDLMPLFMGTLVLSESTDIKDIDEQLPAVADHISMEMKQAVVDLAHEQATPPAKDKVTWNDSKGKKLKTDRALVLENTAYGFVEPNIMDAKLGQRLWADDAPEQKKQRFTEIQKTTTHETYGFRIAGMRVYKGDEDPAELDEEGYKIYGKDWGRLKVNNDNLVDSMRKFIFNKAAKIDEDHGRAVAAAFKVELEHVRDVLERNPSRMYSASLLFVFEGDGEALERAVQYNNDAAVAEMSGTAAAVGKVKELSGRSNLRVDSGIVIDDRGELITTPGEGELILHEEPVVALVDSTDEEEESLQPAAPPAQIPRVLSLKLIDFAHAKFHPKEDGPDENMLLGVRNLIKIFDELSK